MSAIGAEGARGVKAVDLGENHGCVVLSDGGVVCWGSGLNGRLGTGSTANVEDLNDAVRVSQLDGSVGHRAIALSTAYHHSCAVRSDGRVLCWGLNSDGQCGLDPANANVLVATEVAGVTNAVAVTTGDAHSCALRADSTVVCWGSDGEGQLGNGAAAGSSHMPAAVSAGSTNLDGVVAIEAEWSGTCALLSTVGLSCWGNTHQGPSYPTHQVATGVSGFTDITSIAAGGNHVCARRADGRVLCMGANGYGVLGQGHGNAVNGVVEVNGAHTFASIFSGNYPGMRQGRV